MSTVSQKYADSLPEIYRDILSAFPEIEPARKAGWGLAYQTLYQRLERKHSLGLIKQACEQMANAKVVDIENGIFVCPTPLGEEIITLLTGKKAGELKVEPFPSPE